MKAKIIVGFGLSVIFSAILYIPAKSPEVMMKPTEPPLVTVDQALASCEFFNPKANCVVFRMKNGFYSSAPMWTFEWREKK